MGVCQWYVSCSELLGGRAVDKCRDSTSELNRAADSCIAELLAGKRHAHRADISGPHILRLDFCDLYPLLSAFCSIWESLSLKACLEVAPSALVVWERHSESLLILVSYGPKGVLIN